MDDPPSIAVRQFFESRVDSRRRLLPKPLMPVGEVSRDRAVIRIAVRRRRKAGVARVRPKLAPASSCRFGFTVQAMAASKLYCPTVAAGSRLIEDQNSPVSADLRRGPDQSRLSLVLQARHRGHDPKPFRFLASPDAVAGEPGGWRGVYWTANAAEGRSRADLRA